jgi:hypothetical protein
MRATANTLDRNCLRVSAQDTYYLAVQFIAWHEETVATLGGNGLPAAIVLWHKQA